MNHQQHQRRNKGWRLFLATSLFLVSVLFSQDVKLLAGFEYDDMQTWTGWSGTAISEGTSAMGGSYGTLFQGDATEGDWAVGRDISSDAVSWYLTSPAVPDNPREITNK